MRRSARHLRYHALIPLLWLLAPVARAHGPAPVALEVLAQDGASPVWLRTNIGLARAHGDGTYAYVCPSRWDGNELARAAVSRDGSEILVHSLGVAFRSDDGGCTFEPMTDEGLFVEDVIATATGFFVVADDYPDDPDPDSSRLFIVEDGIRTELDRDFPSEVQGALATESGQILSGASFVVDEAGAVIPFELGASRVTPRASRGEEIWLRATGGGDVWLVHITPSGVVSGEVHEIIHGPVWVAERWVVLFDGVLHERVDGVWEQVAEVPWTCLRSIGGRSYACSLEAMFELGGGTPLPSATAVFSMPQLGSPERCGGPERERMCEREWAHFGGESGWLETDPATAPLAPRRPMGCQAAAAATGGAPSVAMWWALAVLTLGRGARTRRRSAS